MNAAQLHLALNHLPIVLPLVAAPLLVVGIVRRSDDILQVAWALVIVAAVMTWPVYLSGEPTESLAKNYPGVSRLAIHDHETAARFALWALQILGAACLARWVAFRYRRPLPRSLDWWLAVVAVAVFGMVARTGHLGGLIRHEEIQHGEYLQ